MEKNDRQINVGPVRQNRYSELFQREEKPFPPTTVIYNLWMGKSRRGVYVCVCCSKLLLIITPGLFAFVFIR